jgi:hypothetical protein
MTRRPLHRAGEEGGTMRRSHKAKRLFFTPPILTQKPSEWFLETYWYMPTKHTSMFQRYYLVCFLNTY